MIATGQSMRNREFQYHAELPLKTTAKDYESICDQQYQAANLPKSPISHSRFQSRLTMLSPFQMQTHR
jgi:hypothetical protein